MSFSSFECEIPENSTVLCSAASNIEPVVAIGCHGIVRFYSEEGEGLPHVVERACPPTQLSWHPNRHCLVIGWADGTVSCVDGSRYTAVDDRIVHASSISLLSWSPDGNRLITGDMAGVIGVWGLESRNKLSNLQQYQKNGAITQCAFIGSTTLEENDDADNNVQQESYRLFSFLVGGDSGIVTYADDMGTCSDVLTSLNSPIDVMEFFPSSGKLVIITRGLLMTQMQVAPDGNLTTILRAKVSMKAPNGINSFVCVGPGLLATVASEENQIRIWDLLTDDHYSLRLSSTRSSVVSKLDKVSTLAFNPLKSILAVGTQEGRLLFWRFSLANRRRAQAMASSPTGHQNVEALQSRPTISTSSEKDWSLLDAKIVGSGRNAVVSLDWCPTKAMIVASTAKQAFVWSEEIVRRAHCKDVSVVVRQAHTVEVSISGMGSCLLETTIIVKGIDCSSSHLVLWNGKQAELYEIRTDEHLMSQSHSSNPISCKLVSSLEIPSYSMVIHRDSLIAGSSVTNEILVYNFQGTIRHRMKLSDMDGMPQYLCKNNTFMAVTTTNARLFIYDIDRAEPHQLHKGFFQHSRTGAKIGQILSVAINTSGSQLSLIAATPSLKNHHETSLQDNQKNATVNNDSASLAISSRIYVYDAESDVVAARELGQGRLPVYHCWDQRDPKLLAVQTERFSNVEEEQQINNNITESKHDDEESDEPPMEVVVLFAHPDVEGGAVVHDVVSMEQSIHTGLLGVNVPMLYFCARADAGVGVRVQLPLRDFAGIEDCDDKTRDSLLKFSYELARGNMDEAHRAVKAIDNPQVWRNMAHMCVKSKRLDVAEVCLANMGHIRGLRAVKNARRTEPQREAVVAMIAVQLGLLSDAAKLYSNCGRYDLLNQLYQDAGEWERALNVAKTTDRIHLKETEFLYAKHLEANACYGEAIQHYEAAGVHLEEVPRMLIDAGKLPQLAEYVDATDSPEMTRWWAQYLESQGDFDRAVQYYRRAASIIDLVRVFCYQGDFHSARQLVLETDDKAAAYHLARQNEAHGNYKEALVFFERSGRYNHAVRLAKETGEDEHLITLALQSTKSVMREAAKYFEEKGLAAKAVQLYHRSGAIGQALDLCFREQLHEDLQAITDDLSTASNTEGTSPEVLDKCATFFLEHNQYDKAVKLLVSAHQYERAINLCVEHRVRITEELADAMTLPKQPTNGTAATETYKEERQRLLLSIAEVCERQNAFHLATKKYTQAGDKTRAMRALLKSGDTEKIVFFAGVSRSREIYILAANYLQSLNWSEDPEIVKNIISFYSKARAYEQLSSFFDACASVEIDEFRNYEKALKALREALKHANKIRSSDKETRVAMIQTKMEIVEEFVKARSLFKSSGNELNEICQNLLAQRELEQSVRAGDVFALMISHAASKGNMQEAFRLIEDMQSRGIQLGPFIEPAILQAVSAAVGVDFQADVDTGSAVDEEIEEDI